MKKVLPSRQSDRVTAACQAISLTHPVHLNGRTSVLQELSGVDGQPEAAGVPEGDVQGGRIWLERQQHRSRGPEAA